MANGRRARAVGYALLGLAAVGVSVWTVRRVAFGAADPLSAGIGFVSLLVGTGHLLSAVPWTAVALFGATLFTALLAPCARGRIAMGAAILGSAGALTIATDTVWTIMREHWSYSSIAVDRHLFTGFGGYWQAAWTPAVLVVAAAVVARAPRRRDLGLIATGAVAGGGVAIVATQLRIAHVVADAQILHLLTDRRWMCALTGWAVAAVALLRHRSLPAALPAGAVAAMSAGLMQYTRDILTGHRGQDAANLAGFVRMPVWLLCAVFLLSLPLVWLLPSPRLRRWPAAAGLVAAVAAVAVANGSVATATGREGDLAAFRAAMNRTEPAGPFRVTPAAALPANGPGRSLTPDEATALLARVRASLPAGWEPAPDSENHPDTGVRPDACDRRWDADRAAEQARGALGGAANAPDLPDAELHLTLALASYPHEGAARSLIDEGGGDVRACPMWSVDFAKADDHRMRAAVTAGVAPALPYPGYLMRITLTVTVRGRAFCIALVRAATAVGKNVTSVQVSFPLPGRTTVPEARWQDAEAFATGALRSTVAALGG